MQAIKLPLSKFPIWITCYENGLISFDRAQNFKVIIDGDVILSNEDIKIGELVIEYGQMVEYKQEPSLLKWLQSLNMEMPNIRQGF